MWFVIFIVFTIWQFAFKGVSNEWWFRLWHFKVYLTLILGISCTVWFLVGGIVDVVKLFWALSHTAQNDADDGSVVDGAIAGEK